MGKLQELDKLDRAIKDAESAIRSITIALEQINNEIIVLSPRFDELQNSLKFLKQQHTIPLAHEYRKIKNEHIRVKSRLNILTSDRAEKNNALKLAQRALLKLQKDYHKLIIIGENNVVSADFGGKKWKKV